MGRQQRSRRYLPPDAICYLCGLEIRPDQPWNRDHVPPERVFGKTVKQKYSPNLTWLPTHVTCNSDYKADEEYFVTALVGHHRTATGSAVWADVARGAAAGHSQRLIKAISGQFGQVATTDGAIMFALDAVRACRVVWKLVRGLYTLETERVLPESQPHHIEIVTQSEAPKYLPSHAWFPIVRDTAPLGQYGAVFDYKWICVRLTDDGRARGHAVAMLLWDALVMLAMFHDAACACDACSPASATA